MYAKVFRSIFDGSLYGRFDATVTFLAMLVIADKNGVVDMTAEKLAVSAGFPLDIIQRGIAELEKPDPRSRTPDEDGRRITLLHDAGWGWQIVNYAKYREIRSAEERREYFRQKKAEQRAKSKSVQQSPHCPPESTAFHPSEADAEADSEAEACKRARKARSTRCPSEFQITDSMREWAKTECQGVDIDFQTRSFKDHEFAKAKSDWNAAWRNWMRSPLSKPKRGSVESEFQSLPPELR